VLSGFVTYRPFVAARILGAPGQRLGDYARKRFLRIYPAYWLALTALALYPGLHGVFTGNWWVYYGILQNFPIYDATADCQREVLQCGISASWSIGIEVVFYALLPLYALLIAWLVRGSRGRRWLGVELGILGLLFAISLYYQYEPFGPSDWLNATPFPLIWWLGSGMALAVLSVAVEKGIGKGRALDLLERHSGVLWAGGTAIFAWLVFAELGPYPITLIRSFEGTRDYWLQFFFYGVIAWLLVVPAIFGAGRGGLPRRLLANRLSSWLGVISLGVYLWHVPLLLWLLDRGALTWTDAPFLTLTAATIALSVSFGAASYYLVERPLLRRKNRRLGEALKASSHVR
jgi:peptidoglycan/LPS O-acetylase OafA/YrhL